jgi:transcriptional regulator with XRE-family HTH domain
MARLTLLSPPEVRAQIGQRARDLRLHQNLSQAELAGRSGVGLRTVQRFERSGNATVEVLVRIAFALGVEVDLAALFPIPEPRTLDDVLRADAPARKRARRRTP